MKGSVYVSVSVFFLKQSQQLSNSIRRLIGDAEMLKLGSYPTLHRPSAGCSDRFHGEERVQDR